MKSTPLVNNRLRSERCFCWPGCHFLWLNRARKSAAFPAWWQKPAAIAAGILTLLAAPAAAEPPDIADLVGVHREMRRAATIPEPTWPLRDGRFDCDDWARWAASALEARGWPREALAYYFGPGLDGEPHMALCAVLDGYESPICLDRQMNMITPLSAYGSEWRRVDFR
jgi:hypothetical protein